VSIGDWGNPFEEFDAWAIDTICRIRGVPLPSEENMEDKNKIKVTVNVVGGVAHPVEIPPGVEVIVRDYDTDGCDDSRAERDEFGDLCFVGRYTSDDCAHEEEECEKDLDDSRSWRCPECGLEAVVSYEDLAEIGNPICDQCDVEMELV